MSLSFLLDRVIPRGPHASGIDGILCSADILENVHFPSFSTISRIVENTDIVENRSICASTSSPADVLGQDGR